MSDISPGDALRAIADHFDHHPPVGIVTVMLDGGPLDSAEVNLDVILDGATVGDVEIEAPETTHPLVTRMVDDVRLSIIVRRELISVRRPTITEQVLTTTELLARRDQQVMAVES